MTDDHQKTSLSPEEQKRFEDINDRFTAKKPYGFFDNLFFYFALIFICLLGYSHFSGNDDLLYEWGWLLISLIGISGLHCSYKDYRKGVVSIRSIYIDRKEKPKLFFFALGFNVVASSGAFILGVYARLNGW